MRIKYKCHSTLPNYILKHTVLGLLQASTSEFSVNGLIYFPICLNQIQIYYIKPGLYLQGTGGGGVQTSRLPFKILQQKKNNFTIYINFLSSINL